MTRSFNDDDVLRRSLRFGTCLLVLPFILAVGPACGDAPNSFRLFDSTGVPVPRVAGELRIDSAELRALGGHPVPVGTRVMVAADTGAPESVSASEVSVQDTTVAGIDSEGMLYALGIGKTWVTWSIAQVADSSLLTVASEDPPVDQLAYVAPVAPKATVDVRYPSGRTRGTAGKSVRVPVGGDLQAALDGAQPGDEIILASGATFTGNYVLPAKKGDGSEWTVVRAEVVGVAAGTRMTPAHAANAARVVTPNQDPAFQTAVGARGWRLVGFQVEHAPNAIYNYGIIVLGRGDERTLEAQPSDIVLDRMYVHGSPSAGNSRCVAFNGRSLAVIDSWLSECHAKGNDAQGICGWSGGGPFLIENNYIEASGQAVMFGGADPVIANLSPSDITIRHNYFFKPLSWARGVWTVKAAFELKHGKRVLFEGNVIENHWADAQTGYAILLQTVSDNGTSTSWVTVSDIMMRNNIIKNSTGGLTIAGTISNGGPLPSNPSSRIVLINNLWLDVGVDPISPSFQSRVFMLLGNHHDVTVIDNTAILNGRANAAILLDGATASTTTLANNVFPNSEYGVFGSGKTGGTSSLQFYLPGAVFVNNVLPQQSASYYPTGNFFPESAPVPGQSSSDLECRKVKSWLANALMPAGTGADCDALDLAVRNVVTPGN